MRLSDLDSERREHPLDAVERLAADQAWSFDRFDDDEMSVEVAGSHADYRVAFTWIEDMETLHVASAFDLRVPERRRAEMLQLISLVNEQMWVGHFDVWQRENVVMFRHALLLTGGAEPTSDQCGTMARIAVEACDRYYQAFQFLLWAGKSPREALDSALFETKGHA